MSSFNFFSLFFFLDLSAVSTEAVATPGSHTDGFYLNATRESREFSRERSVESNTSSSSGRGATEESETRCVLPNIYQFIADKFY